MATQMKTATEEDVSTGLYFRDIIGALSYALDLTEGQPPGHCVRCCWIGTHIAKALSVSDAQLKDIYYTLLLKDSGCSSNAARLCALYGSDDRHVKHAVKTVDVQDKRHLAKFVLNNAGLESNLYHKFKTLFSLMKKGESVATELIQTRCERGAEIAKMLGLGDNVAQGIYSLDEHYNGRGHAAGLHGDSIPLASRIALVAQCVDVFNTSAGREASIAHVVSRSGTWFDPGIVACFKTVAESDKFWEGLASERIDTLVSDLMPESQAITVTEAYLDDIVAAFGKIVDAKSPYTAGHSERVGEYARALGQELGIVGHDMRVLNRAAILHDLGKLGVSNTILDKPGKLTDEEWVLIKAHPRYSEEILSRLPPFSKIARIAGAHHERLDGKGYYRNLRAEEICLETRIITVCDVYDALSADRPYRDAMPQEKAFSIMDNMVGEALDPQVLSALKKVISS